MLPVCICRGESGRVVAFGNDNHGAIHCVMVGELGHHLGLRVPLHIAF